MLRKIFLLDPCSVRAKEAFNSVFGVTNISTSVGSNGTRGLHYYFHCNKALGSICGNAMHVLLVRWRDFCSGIVCDTFRLKCIDGGGTVDIVKAEFEKRSAELKWVVGRETHEAYSRIDMLIGYAEYLRHDSLNVPSVTKICEFAAQSGKYQQPSRPVLESARKAGCSKAVKQFLDQYDGSLRGPKASGVGYFVVANPARPNGSILKTGEDDCCDVVCMLVGSQLQQTIDSLNTLFVLRYGSDGQKRFSRDARGDGM